MWHRKEHDWMSGMMSRFEPFKPHHIQMYDKNHFVCLGKDGFKSSKSFTLKYTIDFVFPSQFASTAFMYRTKSLCGLHLSARIFMYQVQEHLCAAFELFLSFMNGLK